MNVLDLFSGIGGFALGLERAGMRPVGFCELEPFCRAVLAEHWPGVPCAADIGAMQFRAGEADIVCGGFPCQDISMAGDAAGIAGERSGLWRELLRAICVVRPRYALVENVAALLVRGMGDVLGDLAAVGYDAEWHCIPACAIGAPHVRDRVWIIADPASRGLAQRRGLLTQQQIADAAVAASGQWDGLSDVGRAVHGIPRRMDRIRALGNAVVPQIPEMIGRVIIDADTGH